MKAVLLSVRPEWCKKEANGEKTIEVRKSRPKIETPFKSYVYCTKGRPKFTQSAFCEEVSNGKVVGEFVCDAVYPIQVFENGAIKDWHFNHLYEAQLSFDEMAAYIGCGKTGYGWNISGLKIYDKPKHLSDFYKSNTLSLYDFLYTVYDGSRTYAEYLFSQEIRRPPQSWCYVEEM